VSIGRFVPGRPGHPVNRPVSACEESPLAGFVP